MPSSIRVVYVDENAPAVAERLERANARFEVMPETSVTDALALLELESVDCLVTAAELPDLDGLTLLDRVREQEPTLPVILYAGDLSNERASDALADGLTDYLDRASDTEEFDRLAARIEDAVDATRYRQLLDDLPADAFQKASPESEGYLERVVEDIAKQKRDIDELASAKARFEGLFEESPDMVFVHDADGNILDVNERVPEKLGYPREKVAEMAPWEIDPTLTATDAREAWAALAAGESPMFDGVFERADGSTFPVEVHVTPLGETDELLSIGRDVSKRRERERQLDQRREELHRQNQRLEEFVDVLSHDVPNHLNVAQTRLDIAMQRDEFGHLDHVETAHGRIETIITDMKSLVKQGREVEEQSWLSLSGTVRPCWENCCGQYEDATFQIPQDGQLRANESRLKQLFENLFWNAHEHAGEDVTLRVGLFDEGFFIEDDGPGIPEDDREAVLSPGYTTDEDDHSGFGLAIVREITHAHDWEVSITDGSDGGARFEFTGVTVEQ